jgi:hypothetical protein
MRRRWLLLGAGALALLGLAALLLVAGLPALLPSPTLVKAEKIKPGMGLDEAENVLGPQAVPCCMEGTLSSRFYVFSFPDGYIVLVTDTEHRVNACKFYPGAPSPLWERLRRLLPW